MAASPRLPSLLLPIAVLTVAGCSTSMPAYRRVDRTSAAYQEALAAETARQQDAGKSARAAANAASERVTADFIAQEKRRRTDLVAPLITALTEMDRSRGCWSFTRTITKQRDDTVTVTVERYDPFQPKEKLWTLVSRNGRPASEADQAAYRRKREHDARRERSRANRRGPAWEQAKKRALRASINVEPAVDGRTIFTFVLDPAHVTGLGDIPRMRYTYTVDGNGAAPRLVRYVGVQQTPASLLVGAIKVQRWLSENDYVVVDPTLPPFAAKTVLDLRGSVFGKDTGNVRIETVYTDYKRVKCYDDRFEVRVGEPTLSDLSSSSD